MRHYWHGIEYLINKAIDKAPFDKVKNGQILAQNQDGSYNVLVDNKTYTANSLNNSVLSTGSIVKILIPQNEYSNMFILN